MALPDMHYVDSSNVEAVGYDAANEDIYVQFHGGSTYVYTGADQQTFDELRYADSVGSYLNRVLKPGYAYRRL